MSREHLAIAAVGCVGALAIAGVASADTGESVKIRTYEGAKLRVRVAPRRLTLSEVRRPVVRRRCVVSKTGRRRVDSFSIGVNTFRGKRPTVGGKSVRSRHTERKLPTGGVETIDLTLTLKFISHTKARLVVKLKSRSPGPTGTVRCVGRATDTVSP